MSTAVAVDVGGTFTDVSILSDTGFTMWKVRSTPDPVDGVLAAVVEGLRVAGATPARVDQLLQATTVATNAIFERTGARTALVTTEGFGSVIHIGREVRTGPERFQITLPKPDPFVAEPSVYEVPERLRADGSVHIPLDETAVRAVADQIRAGDYETVAISLLHAYRNPEHERRVKAILDELLPELDIMLSHEVCPEPGEYERSMTTIVSAYISPLVGRYVERLHAGLVATGVDADIVVVGSDGAGIDARELRSRPITCLESGPVAGVLAGKTLAEHLGIRTCLTLDIGGTTSKAGLVVDGRIELTNDFRVGGPVSAASRRSASAIPVRVPVVDLAEMGVGGGSIAWVDEAGLLRVGPHSAGATPGPASFALGGEEATVTDAAVVTGILAGRTLLGTDQLLDVELATKALGGVGAGIGQDPVGAAVAVRGVASAEIAAAVQRLLFYRGVDPAELTLMAFGGTGPLHAAEVADIVGIRSLIVPRAAGVFTTFGLLSSEIGMERSQHVRLFLGERDADAVQPVLEGLEAEAAQMIGGAARSAISVERSADVRFRHQIQTQPLNLPNGPITDQEILELFRREYQRQFGLTSEDTVEIVQLRVRVTAKQTGNALPVSEQTAFRSVGTRRVNLTESGDRGNGAVTFPVYELSGIGDGAVEEVRGPALVDLTHTTVVVPPSWAATVLPNGDVQCRRTD